MGKRNFRLSVWALFAGHQAGLFKKIVLMVLKSPFLSSMHIKFLPYVLSLFMSNSVFSGSSAEHRRFLDSEAATLFEVASSGILKKNN